MGCVDEDHGRRAGRVGHRLRDPLHLPVHRQPSVTTRAAMWYPGGPSQRAETIHVAARGLKALPARCAVGCGMPVAAEATQTVETTVDPSYGSELVVTPLAEKRRATEPCASSRSRRSPTTTRQRERRSTRRARRRRDAALDDAPLGAVARKPRRRDGPIRPRAMRSHLPLLVAGLRRHAERLSNEKAPRRGAAGL